MRARSWLGLPLLGALLLLVPLLLGPHASRAQEAPVLRSDAFTLRQWTVEDGLPVNTIYDVQPGAGGFLWLATHDGLVRFDGVRFATFGVADTPARACSWWTTTPTSGPTSAPSSSLRFAWPRQVAAPTDSTPPIAYGRT